MYTKADIFNLALGALLLQRRIVNTDTDLSNEAKVLNTHWNVAFNSTLEDLDLDSTSTQAVLELLEEDPTTLWKYAYRYPTDCLLFRRIQSCQVADNKTSHILKRVAIHDGNKVIFTNQVDAIAEFISKSVPLSSLSAQAGMAVAYRLAYMSSPLVTGKGAAKLAQGLQEKYVLSKAEAQEQDRRENFVFHDEALDSEFVEARLS